MTIFTDPAEANRLADAEAIARLSTAWLEDDMIVTERE